MSFPTVAPAGAAVIFASAPVGVNVYVFATRYATGVDMAAGAITPLDHRRASDHRLWLWVAGIG